MNAVLLTALLLGQPQAPLPPQAPPVLMAELPQAPPVKVLPQAPRSNYSQAAALAIAAGKPLVVFVGVPPVTGDWYTLGANLTASPQLAELLEGGKTGIIVAVPSGDWLDWRATLPATAGHAEIQAAIRGQAVQPPASPFPLSGESLQAPLAADADDQDEVSSILSGMEQYRSTQVAQVSGNRSGNGANWVVSRFTLPAKWHQPGGLEGLTGWSNKLYRKRGNPVRNWFGHVNDWENYGGGWGSEITYQRSYGDGAKFADVLSTGKGVFEVRVAERSGGEWRRSVPYRDANAEPAGYKRVSLQQCAGCHDQAGDGGYGTARIIGGGGVLSEPFPQLER